MSTWKKQEAHTVGPYLIVDGVADLIYYLQHAFDAELKGRLDRPNGTLMHAEIMVGDSLIMMGEPMGEFSAMPSNLFVYVPDARKTIDKAITAGGKLVMELTEMQHAGVRYGGVQDPSGNNWWIGTHVRDMSWQEQQEHINATAQSWSNE